MRSLFLALVLLLAAPAGALERPEIFSVTPESFVQQDNKTTNIEYVLVIKGRNLWPDDESVRYSKSRVIVMMRYQGGFEPLSSPIRGIDGDYQTLTVKFSSKKWLQGAGKLQVQVKVDDMGSLIYPLTIVPPPTSPAKIHSIKPSKFTVAQELPYGTLAKDHFRFELRGANLDNPKKMVLRVNNRTVKPDLVQVKDGYLVATVPSRLWNYPGEYRVSLRNRRGAAKSAYITIQAPQAEEEARRAAEEAARQAEEEALRAAEEAARQAAEEAARAEPEIPEESEGASPEDVE